MGYNFNQQVDNVCRRVEKKHRQAAVRALNAGAQELAKWSRGAARQRSFTDTRGKRLPQSIRVQRATSGSWPPVAIVFIDTEQVPHAAYVHENYKGYTIRPKVTKYLYRPLTAAGRSHELHKHDSQQKRLKGWLYAGKKSRPVGHWSMTDLRKLRKSPKAAKDDLDFVLTKGPIDIPPNPRAGFLTQTAKREHSRILKTMRHTYFRELNR